MDEDEDEEEDDNIAEGTEEDTMDDELSSTVFDKTGSDTGGIRVLSVVEMVVMGTTVLIVFSFFGYMVTPSTIGTVANESIDGEEEDGPEDGDDNEEMEVLDRGGRGKEVANDDSEGRFPPPISKGEGGTTTEEEEDTKKVSPAVTAVRRKSLKVLRYAVVFSDTDAFGISEDKDNEVFRGFEGIDSEKLSIFTDFSVDEEEEELEEEDPTAAVLVRGKVWIVVVVVVVESTRRCSTTLCNGEPERYSTRLADRS